MFSLLRKSNKLASIMLSKSIRASFSGGVYPPKTYDWRDDHAQNHYFEQDPRLIGIKDGHEYEYPHNDTMKPWESVFPKEYNAKDLTVNFVGTYPVAHIGEANFINAPHQNLFEDIAHEWQYDSQDADFQPESVKGQHYRKKGHWWIWIVMGLTPYWYVITQVIYNEMTDPDAWRWQRAPPLNYPSEEDSPDFETVEGWKSGEFKYLWDAGLMVDPYFEIVDGKKVYSKWAGVNQPTDPIHY